MWEEQLVDPPIDYINTHIELTIKTNSHPQNQPHHTCHLPRTNATSKYTPDQSQPNPNWTDLIYANKNPVQTSAHSIKYGMNTLLLGFKF